MQEPDYEPTEKKPPGMERHHWPCGTRWRCLAGNTLSFMSLGADEINMKKSTLLTTGIIGTMITALCCFTPLLVMLFGAVGLAAWIGHLDAVLMPALIFFLALTVYAIVNKEQGH